jgi:AcrR family transcriptional regulator
VSRSGRRGALLEAGLGLFSAHAYDELSIDEIAARLGIAKGLLYYYFGSKRGYYVAVVEFAAGQLREQWDTDPALPAADRLTQGLDAYLRYAEDHAEGYRALMAGGIGTDAEVRGVLDAERERVIALVVEALGASEAGPALRVALQGWLSFMEGATLEWLAAGGLERTAVLGLILHAFGGTLDAARAVDAHVPELVLA